uniref:Sec1 family domain-containing protein 1 n=1 Tax=Amphora coffeiformis TaxID=265554 RepID=A0A7S3L1A1_9STRA
MSDSFSLKACQLRAVHGMLSLEKSRGGGGGGGGGNNNNNNNNNNSSTHAQWKILIYDAPCRSIISPLLSVQQLRREGVTLHLNLSSEREAIPDVPAVYFCRPTKANLARIAQDAVMGLYPAGMYLNFVPHIARDDLEDLAKLVVQARAMERIVSLHDRYVSYVCLENRLFSLHQTASYQTINSAQTTEAAVTQLLTETAHGLLSVVASTGVWPIIRCPRNSGAPEMVARQLHALLMEQAHLIQASNNANSNIINNNIINSNSSSTTNARDRPLLVILDRNADLLTALQHTSTYQALIDDLLQHKANRVEFDVTPTPSSADAAKKSAAKPTRKRYDLDADADPFYAAQKFQAFPVAIESNSAELQQVTERETAIKTSGRNTASGTGDDLATAVESLPALLERKKQLEVHTSILQAVMNAVAARDVPAFYELETALATGSYKNDTATAKNKVLQLIQDATKGNLSDKVRLALCLGLATSAPPDWQALRTAVEEVATTGLQAPRAEIQAALAAMDYVQKLSSVQRMVPLAVADGSIGAGSHKAPASSSSTNETSKLLSSFMAKATTQATGLLAKATDKVAGMMSGKIHKHHATVVVEHLCDYKQEDDTYLYLDPKVSAQEVNVAQLKESGVMRAPVKHVWVFVVGGGSYTEYQNLQMLPATVTYGSTEILNATQFWQQLGALGKQ